MRDAGLLDVGGFRPRYGMRRERARLGEHGWPLAVAGVIALLGGLGILMLYHAGVLQVLGQ